MRLGRSAARVAVAWEKLERRDRSRQGLLGIALNMGDCRACELASGGGQLQAYRQGLSPSSSSDQE